MVLNWVGIVVMVAEDGEKGALLSFPSFEVEEFVDDKKHMWSLIGFSFPKSDYVSHMRKGV